MITVHDYLTKLHHKPAEEQARHLPGPYELDPQTSVLTTRDASEWPLQKAGHGELVQTSWANGIWRPSLAGRSVTASSATACSVGRPVLNLPPPTSPSPRVRPATMTPAPISICGSRRMKRGRILGIVLTDDGAHAELADFVLNVEKTPR